MNITFRDIVWVGIIALILVVLSKCHRDKSNLLKEQVNELVDKRRRDDSSHASQVAIMENKQALAEGRIQIATTQQQKAERDLEQSLATAKRLSAQLREIKGWPTDTTAITVPQEFFDYCDSLAWAADSIHADYRVFKRKNSYLLLAKDTALSLQKDLYHAERNARLKCREDFESLQHFYKLADRRAKPANQVYIGAELLGSERLLIQNIGVAISLKTKSNKLWQVSGGLQNGGGWYGRINGNVLIRLRKQ